MRKNVVITGAARGLGLALVRYAKKLGYCVFAGSRKISEELLVEAGENCFLSVCDVTDDASIAQFFSMVRAHTDAVDILINNAGIWLDQKRLFLDDPDFCLSEVQKQYDVNAVGILRMVRQFLPLLKCAQTPVVFNISSEAGSITSAQRKCEYGYCMSKAAQNMATKLMQNAYPEIRFYAIHPGWMKTDQGFAGATATATPQQEPADTAKVLYEMAEQMPSEIYYNIDGTSMPW